MVNGHSRRVDALARRMETPVATQIEGLIEAMEPIVEIEIETGDPQPLPVHQGRRLFFDEQEKIIDCYARQLPKDDLDAFAGFMATGELLDDPSEILIPALHAQLLLDLALQIRVGKAPVRKQNRGWVST